MNLCLLPGFSTVCPVLSFHVGKSNFLHFEGTNHDANATKRVSSLPKIKAGNLAQLTLENNYFQVIYI